MRNIRHSSFKKFSVVLNIVIACLITNYSQAQGLLSGKLVDSTTQKPLYMATVTVFKAADTSIVMYKLTNAEGNFRIPGLSYHIPYRVIVSFVGYGVYKKEFLLSPQQSELALGSIGLLPDATSLDEVLLVSERPPMVIRNDTVEFNANAFRTLPNALVEDLLRKLPGVQVDKEGNITVSGKRVNRITVDGKSFFGSDPKMASRNLPSNVIDKIQITDDKDELLETGDDNLNNVGKVINLTFKKGVKKSLFGKAYAGGGGGPNGFRYEAGAIANIFRDTLQISALGYSNNLNKPGFSMSELLQSGGLSRNREINGSGNNNNNNSLFGSSVTVNGINFGGMSQLGGVTTSNGAGININHSPNKRKSFFAQYYLGKVHTDLQSNRSTQIFNKDTTITNASYYNALVNGISHSVGVGMNLKPDSVTNITATVNYVNAGERNNSNNNQSGVNNIAGLLNNGMVLIDGNTGNNILRQYFSITRQSKTKKGRRISFTQGLNWNRRKVDNYTNADIHYFYPNQFDSATYQLRQENVPAWYVYGGANYRDPIGKRFFLRAGLRYEYEELKNQVTTLAKNNDHYDLPNYDLSSSFLRKSNKYFASSGLEFRHKDLSITPGVRYQFQRFDNAVSYLPNNIIQRNGNILPTLEITYKKLTVNMIRDIILPDYNYVIPVRNNTNPYIINLGNVNLVPTIRNSININLNTFNPKNNLNVWGWGEVYTAQNDVVQNISLDKNGVQTIQPVNADGSSRIATNFGLGQQNIRFKNSFTLSWNFGTWTEFRRNKFFYNKEESSQKRLRSNIWSAIGFNWNDKLEITPSYSFSYASLKNSNPRFVTTNTFQQVIGTELVLRHIKHIVFDANLNYFYNNAFTNRAYRQMYLLNAGVNFTFFTDERAVLRVNATDILNQSQSSYVFLNQNTSTTVYNNIMGQYFMATFTYNMRPSGTKKKVGGTWSLW